MGLLNNAWKYWHEKLAKFQPYLNQVTLCSKKVMQLKLQKNTSANRTFKTKCNKISETFTKSVLTLRQPQNAASLNRLGSQFFKSQFVKISEALHPGN